MLELILFNTLNLNNDLTGNLKGSVLLAQSTIIPSRATPVAGDVQPRLVSLRDTLVMLKPIGSGVDYSKGVQMSVQDQDTGKVLYTTTMKKPQELTPLAESVEGVDEMKFIALDKYDYVIDKQSEFNKLKDDSSGAYLTGLLKTYNSIKIVLADGNWSGKVYVPKNVAEQDKKLIVFEHKATYDTEIHYSDKTVKIRKNYQFALKNVKGKWHSPADIKDNTAVAIFADPGTYQHSIAGGTELRKLDNQGAADASFATILKSHSVVEIKLADGAWNKNIYLPSNNASYDGKRIIVSNTATYSSDIYYMGVSQSVSKGQKASFINVKGVWVEWVDAGYSRIRYGDNFWSASIPWSHVTPKMKVVFTVAGTSGEYNNVAVGAPTELTINTIDIGMLTPNRGAYPFQSEVEYQRQVFQQTPVSRLIVNQYEPVYWKEIVISNGTTYTSHSPTVGGYYDGDMRGNIGKELISLGINNASYGIHSSAGTGEFGINNTFTVGQLTSHNSVGKYSNGVTTHGLSGGNSMITLDKSVGNEFSHEAGHNFGLPHYPNGFNGSIHRQAGQINSTWGWDSQKNVFLPNFAKKVTGNSTCYESQCQASFHGHSFGSDAMAGGGPFYHTVNAYTLYTPHSHNKIQLFMEGKKNFNTASATGYSAWNATKKVMEPWSEFVTAEPSELNLASMTSLLSANRLVEIFQQDGRYTKDIFIPAASSANNGKGLYIVHNATLEANLSINGAIQKLKKPTVLSYVSDGKKWNAVKKFPFAVAKKPKSQGVRITTLLGFYDPENKLKSYIYPALHAASGNEFEQDRSVEIEASACHAEILNKSNASRRFVLRPERENASNMNRFHVNVPSSFGAVKMTIFCNGKTLATRTLEAPVGNTQVKKYGQGS